jgi:acetolactate synthase-1/2/3 large subunit
MRVTGGEAVVRSLEANGVEVAFGIPGVHNLAVYDALLDSGIRHIAARHEQGAAFMADGYARASGRVGVCLCTSGPALLNAATSLGTAYCDSSPVLCIASQIPSEAIGKEKGYIHECRDQLACVRPVTGWCERAETVASIPEVLHEAFARMQNGRPRPVAIEVPCDVLDAFGEATISAPAQVQRVKPPPEQIERAVDLLKAARFPVIWAGGGVITSGASDELKQLAEHLQAPVCSTVPGKGALPDDHPLSAGASLVHPAADEFLRKCDVMLAVGTRFTQEDTNNWTLPFPETLIHIDIDPKEHGRNYKPTVPLLGDARESLRELNARLMAVAPRDGLDRITEVAELRKRILDDCRDLAPDGVELVDMLRAALPRDTIIVSDLTLAAYWCRRLLDLYEPRTNIYPWGFCTLGFGIPAAVGAKIARPDRAVVVLSGDGGFQFNCQELAAAVEFEIPIVVLLFNNNAYGVLKPQQQVRYGRSLATDLVNPDFVALARAFGVQSQPIDSLDQIGPALGTAIASGQTWVLEITADVPLPVIEPGMRALHNAV